MTGPEHYLEAEALLGDLARPPSSDDVAIALVHATLALAAATALQKESLKAVQQWIDAAA